MNQPSLTICPLCRFPIGSDRVCTNPACHALLDKGDWSLSFAYGTEGLLPPQDESGPWCLVEPEVQSATRSAKVISTLPIDLDPSNAVYHIGGAPDNHIRIAGAAIPHQVSIHFNRRSKDWWVFDWGSGSDATVNDERFRNRKLKDDDILRVAGAQLRYRSGRFAAEYGTADGVDVAVSGLIDSRRSHPKNGRPGHHLLDRISFVIPDGEFVGVIGPSGCGKSTLIKTLAGLVKSGEGTITFNGSTREDNSRAICACTAYLPQNVDATLHDDLTLEQEIASYSTIHLATRDRVRENTLLKEMGLSDESKNFVGALSGGQRRRAAFLLALLREPSVLLLDEPAAGLDRATETALMTDLKRMTRSGARKTILCATHELANIRLFDRVLVMAEGYLVYNGAPDNLFAALQILGDDDNQRFQALYESLGDISHNRAIMDGIRKNRESRSQPSLATSLPPPPRRADWVACFRGYLGRFGRVFTSFAHSTTSFAKDGPFFENAWHGIHAVAKWVFCNPLVGFVWQPLIVAFCLTCALSGKYTDAPDEQKIVFFGAAIAALWLGMGSSVRSLVSSRTGRCMERLEGVSQAAYLGAVTTSTLVKGLVQGSTLTFFLYLLPILNMYEHPWNVSIPSVLGIWFCIVAVEWIGGMAGLVLSGVCKTENMAVALVPNLAVIALFFSQPLMEFKDEDGGSAAQFARSLPAHYAHLAMNDWNNREVKEFKDHLAVDNFALARTTCAYVFIFFILAFFSQEMHEKNWKG